MTAIVDGRPEGRDGTARALPTSAVPKAIAQIPLITIEPRPLNSRLWQLHSKHKAGTITKDEILELDVICKSLETEQDNGTI